MLFPASTVTGVPTLVSARSACPLAATTSVAVAVLFVGFGSVVFEVTVAVSVITVPGATSAPTFTTTVKVVDAPTAKVPMLHEIEVGEQVHPVVPDATPTDTNVVFVGTTSDRFTVDAALGPLFVTVTV